MLAGLHHFPKQATRGTIIFLSNRGFLGICSLFFPKKETKTFQRHQKVLRRANFAKNT